MKRVAVIGAGRIGKLIAEDLSEDFKVTLIDNCNLQFGHLSEDPFEKMTCIEASFTEDKYYKDCDVVINALPDHIGFHALKHILGTGKNVVDISFMEENPRCLEELAVENKAIAIVDAGFAPGLTNLIVGKEMRIGGLKDVTIMVGGVPKVRTLPWEYECVFSPATVLEEYARPVRVIENNNVIAREALGNIEFVEVSGLGTLEAFETDGLRTLLAYTDINMREKTIRYPGHAEKMKMFRDAGFFSKKRIRVAGREVSPFDVSSKLLEESWGESKDDISIMRVNCRGKSRFAEYELIDYAQKGFTSMARVTGHTCAAAARFLLNQTNIKPGVYPLESKPLQEEGAYREITDHLKKKNICIKTKIREVRG